MLFGILTVYLLLGAGACLIVWEEAGTAARPPRQMWMRLGVSRDV